MNSKEKKTNLILTCVAHFFGFIALFFLFIINVGFYLQGIEIPFKVWGGAMFQSVVALVIYLDLQKTRRLWDKVAIMRNELDETKKVFNEAQRQLNELVTKQK